MLEDDHGDRIKRLSGYYKRAYLAHRNRCIGSMRIYGSDKLLLDEAGIWIEDYEAGKALTLAGSRYILLEFPSDRISPEIHDLLYELQLLHIVPIIAHPERNREMVEDLGKHLELIEAGALAQITAHARSLRQDDSEIVLASMPQSDGTLYRFRCTQCTQYK